MGLLETLGLRRRQTPPPVNQPTIDHDAIVWETAATEIHQQAVRSNITLKGTRDLRRDAIRSAVTNKDYDNAKLLAEDFRSDVNKAIEAQGRWTVVSGTFDATSNQVDELARLNDEEAGNFTRSRDSIRQQVANENFDAAVQANTQLGQVVTPRAAYYPARTTWLNTKGDRDVVGQKLKELAVVDKNSADAWQLRFDNAVNDGEIPPAKFTEAFNAWTSLKSEVDSQYDTKKAAGTESFNREAFKEYLPDGSKFTSVTDAGNILDSNKPKVKKAMEEAITKNPDLQNKVLGESELKKIAHEALLPILQQQRKEVRVENGKKAKELYGKGGSKTGDLPGYDKFNDLQKSSTEEFLAELMEKSSVSTSSMTEEDIKKLGVKAAQKAKELAETKLDAKVNELLGKSESLKETVVKLQKDGWTIKKGVAGKGSYCSKTTKTIVIDPNEPPEEATGTLGHEAGHAVYVLPPKKTRDKCASAEEYILQEVEANFLDEGHAQFTACRVAKELELAGEPGIEVPADSEGKFMATYEKFLKKEITMEAAIKENALNFSDLVTSTTKEDYFTYYGNHALKTWNKSLPKKTPLAVLPDKGKMFGGMTA